MAKHHSEAQRVVDRLIKAEMAAPFDRQRHDLMQTERLRLMGAIQSKDQSRIRACAAESVRVLESWGFGA